MCGELWADSGATGKRAKSGPPPIPTDPSGPSRGTSGPRTGSASSTPPAPGGGSSSSWPVPTGRSTSPATPVAGGGWASSTPVPAGGTPWPTRATPAPLAPLPPHFARLGRPNIEGEVADDLEKIEVEKAQTTADTAASIAKIVFGILLLPFQPIIVLSALIFRGRTPKEKEAHFIVRVTCLDGTTRVARFERELRKASLSAGDYVSIWGTVRGGICVAQHAYNRTVSAEVL